MRPYPVAREAIAGRWTSQGKDNNLSGCVMWTESHTGSAISFHYYRVQEALLRTSASENVGSRT